MFQTSVIFKKNYESKAQGVVNQGGSSSGKTYSILQVLFTKASNEPKSIITVVGQDIPNLKAGALRDALNIVNSSPDLQNLIKSYNKSDRIFEFKNGSIIEFKSYENWQDAKSGKRHYLFINEANGIDFAIYNELAIRTSKQIFIDYNPNSEFWVHEKIIGQPNIELIISDHRHNPFLSDVIRQKIEALKDIDFELWKVYARGMTGKITGLIFSNWFVVDNIPEHAKLLGYGLDFGFTNDPTALVSVYLQNGELWIDEIIYQTGLTNTDISNRLKENGINKTADIIADNAEPKSIEELNRLGWFVIPANKGADSINNGIDILKRYRINITRRSTNLKKEFGSYKWKVDKNGNTLNIPVDYLNHGLDGIRYLALNKLKQNGNGKVKTSLPNTHVPFATDYDFFK